MIRTVTTIQELRQAVHEARRLGKPIGFVPTMGALHEGHASLIRTAVGDTDHPANHGHQTESFVVVSIFVNPTQFGPSEDFERYPRTLEHDQTLCHNAGARLIFAPTVEEMYGLSSFAAGEPAKSTFIEVPGLSDVLDGRSRPGHFRGVATVVAKLFHQVQPDKAYFGEKDAQQLAVIRRMVRDLNMPIEIIGCPTLREEDGLAMSSRNRYLSPQQRNHSTVLYRALTDARERVQEGERDAEFLSVIMSGMLDDTPGCERDYAMVVNPFNFQRLKKIDGEALALIAARFGETRLIDNMKLTSETRLT